MISAGSYPHSFPPSFTISSIDKAEFVMEWPPSSSHPQPHLDSISLDPLFFSQPLADVESQDMPPIPENHPNAGIAPPDGPSHSLNSHMCTATPSAACGSGGILAPGDMTLASQAHSAYRPIPGYPPSAFHTPSQPQQSQIDLLGNMNRCLSDGTIVHQRHRGTTTNTTPRLNPHHPRIFECKWQGCHGTARFSREGDLLRHIKTIHVSPGAYPCPESHCHKVFGRKDHLREHQRRRHGI